jgi:nucleotide-binding universal stress UspA family protein
VADYLKKYREYFMTTLPYPSVAKGIKYLVCVDNREESHIALRLACMKSRMRGHRVMLLHVTAPADFQTLGNIAERMREERLQEGQALLNGLAEEALSTYGIRPDIVLKEGSAGDEIIATITEEPDISMIAIGVAQHNSGRGKLTAWLASQLGSKLFIPIMMIPGNLTDEQLQTLI